MHNLIEFSGGHFEHTLWKVIQTQSFQRLRRIKQLGFSEYVYPGATHTRFSHSLGAYHIAKNLLRVIRERLGAPFIDVRAQHAITAALVHDIGHGPFSHAFEDVRKKLRADEHLGLKLTKHEDLSDEIIRKSDIREVLDAEFGKGFSDNVADLIRAPGPQGIYGAVVSSQFDADRLDYMQRDRLMTGTQLGRVDFAWLMANLEIGELPWGDGAKRFGTKQTFVLGAKSIHAAESYVLGLFQLYPTIYYHKATRGAEKLFTELLSRIFALVLDGNYKKTHLQENHPLITFVKKPDVLENTLRLDDSVIMGALPLMAEAEDLLIQNFSERLQKRLLYKCIDIREKLFQSWIEDDDDVDSTQEETKQKIQEKYEIVEQTQKEIGQKIQEWLAQNQGKNEPTRVLIDSGKREPYKEIEEAKGPLNQIMMKTAGGKIVDINKQSPIIEAIRPFEFFRVYTDEEDSTAKDFIKKTIQEEVEKWKKAKR
ncbi:MAG: HD domain-containing protein [Proteobacteria bacterium]|nr:HD domain-containing protein [Cystobacterineae bacterium]MCL2314828.1 HD domain-containing protein [Pseudomonadota bacterium]